MCGMLLEVREHELLIWAAGSSTNRMVSKLKQRTASEDSEGDRCEIKKTFVLEHWGL